MNDRNEREARLACFVLPIRDRQVLLARHTYGYPDTWAMIGGLAEPGEAIEEAARREVFEETGLVVTTDRLLAVLDRLDIVVVVFEGRVVAGVETPQEAEIAELRWFDLSELHHANAFDLVVQLAPTLPSRHGLISVDVKCPDMRRTAWASVPEGR